MSGATTDKPLHAYLAGLAPDGRGRFIADIVAFDDDALERVHDYIQWLFPLPTRSMAQPGAPVLSVAEATAIPSDARAVAHLRQAAERMKAFYGRTDSWLSYNDHNHLRISRIIQSLRILVGEEEARSFYDSVMARHEAAGSPINPENLRYWRAALAG
jgi:hypothetical protein